MRSNALRVSTACGLLAAIGAGLALTTAAAENQVTPFAANFSVFSKPAPSPLDLPLTEIAGRMGPRPADVSMIRLLATDLGAFSSKLVAFPTRGGDLACYALVGQLGYCWSPKVVPGDKHFNPSALESVVDGEERVQLYGLAFDDVKALRVQVSGDWRRIAVENNGFYLDLPGVRHSQMAVVEATLSDGSVQTYDLQTGL